MSESDSTNTEYPPLSDVVNAHLTGCLVCQDNMKKKPVPNVLPPVAQDKITCSSLLAIYKRYADYEGRVNNIVAHDEYGNEANGFNHKGL